MHFLLYVELQSFVSADKVCLQLNKIFEIHRTFAGQKVRYYFGLTAANDKFGFFSKSSILGVFLCEKSIACIPEAQTNTFRENDPFILH
jgi:hypothetical protein